MESYPTLKHVGNKKHVDLKTKSFDDIKALYEKVKRFDDSFITIGSTEDERKIKEMNEGASDPDKKKKIVKEDVSAKVLAKQDVEEQGTKKRKCGHMKMIARKRKRPQLDVDSDDEHKKCLKIVTFEGTIDSEIMETKSFISKLDKVSSPEGDYLVVYRVNGNFRAFNYLMEVLHIFDRQDLFHLYDLVMKQYSESTPEGIELILWGDLKIMMESSIEVTDQGDFWNDQQDWEIVTWRLYEACGVCILEFKDGTVIHMLVERKYPLSKELLQRMLDFGLEVEVESTAALDLIRVLNSPCFMVKSWLVQDQTVLGKDYSNLLIADSLLKTIWFINAPCYGNEALASPKANGPFEILERIGPVAYRLRLPKELSGVHDTFHVSNLKRCLADASLHMPLDEIKVEKNLRFVEEPVEIMDRKVKSLKRSRISLVKVHWNSKRGPEFTWESEGYMKSKYSQLFVDRADESAMSVTVSLLWIVDSERDRLIVVDRGTRSVPFQLSANDKAGFGHNGAKESKVSETITSVSKVETSNSETSNDKVEMPKIKTVKMSEPIIEEWESDGEDDEIVVKPIEVTKIVKPSFEKIESANARNETVIVGPKSWICLAFQTATGKEISNPLMADSLPKTICLPKTTHFCDSLQSDEDSFDLIELMILCTNFLTMVRDLENLKTTYLIMKKVWVRMHPNRGGLMMQMQRLPSLMRLQMMLETRTTRFQTTIRSEEVFGYILLVIKKLTLKKLDD
ncbi:hypothetical protein Tco_0052662 [Tanacetum coccineum]